MDKLVRNKRPDAEMPHGLKGWFKSASEATPRRGFRFCRMLLMTALSVAAFATFAAPDVVDIQLRQRYPWNGKVDISFTLQNLTAPVMLSMKLVDVRDNTEIPMDHWTDATTGRERTVFGSNRTYHLVWDAGANCDEQRILNAKTTFTFVDGVQLWPEGPYWSVANIGADEEIEGGLYFWWGDIAGIKPNGTTFSYSFSQTAYPAMTTCTKTFESLKSDEWISGDGVLYPKRDAARKQWGGDWRMPTSAELDRLVDSKFCTRTWTTRYGVNGYLIRGVKEGYTDKSIFLPAAGHGYGASLTANGVYGRYWSTVYSQHFNELAQAWILRFYNQEFRTISTAGYYGACIRPVR